MIDSKEEFVNAVVLKMNLSEEESARLKNLLWMELYGYSVTRITETEVAIREQSLNDVAVKMFFVAKSVQGCTKRTLQYYRNTIKYFMNFMNNKPVGEITTNDIRYFLAIKKERDNNSDTNINNYRRVLSAFFGWLHAEEYISKNPVARIEHIRVEKRIKKAFKDTEIERLRYGAAGDVRLTALLELLLSTGCRISEVSGMNLEDLEGDEIVVYGKGKKERVVYLNAKAKLALERYISSRKDKEKPLFVSKDKPHARLLMSQMGAQLRELGRNCGVADVHPHRFRRTAATLALNRGMPIDQVQLMLGHESIETTTIYAVSAQETVKASHKKYIT